MSTQTTNLGLIKDDPSEFYDIGRVNQNLDKIDAAVGDTSEMKTAGGTGTAITLSIPSVAAYKANQKFSFIASANNAGNATTIKVNTLAAKPLYKPNTTTAPNLVAGKAYEVWYNQAGDCFFLKASAEGNAIAANVLAGKTFSNDDDSGITGTMVDNGSVGTINLTSEGSEYLIPQGYHNGLGKVKAVITGLIASVIKAGTTVGGILGTFTADATAVAGEILSGKTAYVNGSKITGTISSKGAATITPGTANQTIAAGQYLSGIQTIAGDADLVAANIKSGVNIFGVDGTLKPREYAGMPTSLGNANYQLMAVDEDYNTYWGSKWVYNTYEVRNKAGTLLRTVSVSTGDTHRLLGCGKFGYTKNKLGNNAIVQHYQENGTLIREFTKGVSDNADPYLFNDNGYVAMIDGSPRKIARWTLSGSFIGQTDLLVDTNYFLNANNCVIFRWSSGTARIQAVRSNNSEVNVLYPNMAMAFFDYINFV